MPSKAHLLIVDDDPNTLATLARAFRLSGYEVTVCDGAEKALDLIKAHRFDLIFSDVVMPGKDGLALLQDLAEMGLATPVVMMSGQAHIQMAVRATQLGAVDFLEKPLSTDKLLLTVENSLRLRRLEKENVDLLRRLGRHEIVWASSSMRWVMQQIDRVAASETRVCIQGETGTGKELVARTLHERSPRARGPFVAVNCAAIPAELIESELFGHEKGAFTGATAQHLGKFEQAHGGTLFLDEIGDMPLLMQAKLLRVLEEGEIERVGSTRPVKVDVRVLTATHCDLLKMSEDGEFRSDLLHRIFVYPLQLPPLRERRDDIPMLVEYFGRQVAEQNNWKLVMFRPDALKKLQEYRWPGNVRELRNAVERLILLAVDQEVSVDTVSLALPHILDGRLRGSLAERTLKFEREQVLQELKANNFSMNDASAALGLERSHLYKKCQQLGIDWRSLRQEK
jgi:two-component system, NtrC family, nitrogen regulation response regulator NtrX